MKTQPTGASVEAFLQSVSDARHQEATMLITLMQDISGESPYMWGPSIIGFGSQHYKYDTGREGDMPRLAFSPRKAAITIYFSEGFERYSQELAALGTHKQSVSCLYIAKLENINVNVLRDMLEQSYALAAAPPAKATTVDEYIAGIPAAARPHFDTLRRLATHTLPNAREVFSYGIVGYKIDDKRARVYISGWKDHVAMYPVPNDPSLEADMAPYIRGKGTLWFSLDAPLPEPLIKKIIRRLAA